MFARLAIFIAFVVLSTIGMVMHARQGQVDEKAEANAAMENIGIYAKAVAHYAEVNPTTVGVAPMASLYLPNGYSSTLTYTGYVSNGDAWVYLLPGGLLSPAQLLRLAGAPDRYLGVKTGTTAADATGNVVFGQDVPIPAAIPNGAAVYLARQLLPPPAGPAASPTAEQPPAPPPLTISAPPIAVVGSPYSTGPGPTYVPPTVPPMPPQPPNGNPSNPPTNPPQTLYWEFQCNTIHTNNKTGTYDGCSITPPESTEYPSPWSPLQLESKWTSGIAMNNSTPCTTLGAYALSPIKVNPSQGVLTEQDGFECGYPNSAGGWTFQ